MIIAEFVENWPRDQWPHRFGVAKMKKTTVVQSHYGYTESQIDELMEPNADIGELAARWGKTKQALYQKRTEMRKLNHARV